VPRPTMLGVVGDSAAGKTTLTRGLVRILGEDKVTHVCTDDYHRYDRQQRAERNITRLIPSATTWTSWATIFATFAPGRRS
jgi:phosphoribulokinase